MRVLIVEDNDIVKENVVEFLQKYGHEVCSVPKALDAVVQLEDRNGEFDVLISDIFLPGASGLNLLKMVKKQFPEITAIIMSGYPSSTAACKALELGADAFLAKPLRLMELTGLLKQIESHRKQTNNDEIEDSDIEVAIRK